MTISKKIRFEVFKRDGFRCAYCGKSPPSVILEIDHIEPKSKGGKNDINNYLTACFDCNRGKRDIPLEKIPAQLHENLEILKEKEAQLSEYRKFISKIEKRMLFDIDEINEIYSKYYPGWRFSDRFKDISIRNFLQLLPKHEIIDALHIAISKYPNDKHRVTQYFCGICWNRIKRR